jgi:hypothetical protein
VHGPAQRVPQPLYYKRYATTGITTAAQRWADLTLDALIAAWNSHRTRLMDMIDEVAEVPPVQRHLFKAAAEAALLNRLIQAVKVKRTPTAVREAMQQHIERSNSAISHHLRNSNAGSLAAKIDSMRLVANALWAIWHGDWGDALKLSTEAEARDPENVHALFARVRILFRLQRHREALESALTVLSIAPHRRGLAEFLGTISEAMMAEARDDSVTAPAKARAITSRDRDLASALEARDAEIRRHEQEIDALKAEICRHEQEARALRASTSWRITAPLRTVRLAISRLVHKAERGMNFLRSE